MPRLLRRLRLALSRPAACVVYDDSYARTVSGVPIDPARAEEILAFLLDRNLVRRRDIYRPVPASLETLLRVHTPAYLESLQHAATLTAIFGFPIAEDAVPEVLDLQRLVVGGTIHATRLALSTGRVAINLKGGLHHAGPGRGSGFCVFNDVAVAIKQLRARGFLAPVLVVDLDLHDGNGTRAAFADDPTVHTFSIHNRTWDDVPAVASTVIALGPDVADATYLAALREALPPVVRAHRPGLVIYVAGCDPAEGDALGNWRITPTGMLARDELVVHTVRGPHARNGVPLVIVPGGGYGTGAWRYTARFLAWLLSGRAVEPPGDMDLVLARFRPIARQLAAGSPATVRATPSSRDDWGFTAEDLAELAAGAGGGACEPRVLGRYSRHGFELLLERLGVLKQLRDRGFRHPVLEVDSAHGAGETIRVWGGPERTERLIELRVNVNRRVVPGMDVLYVEWLLLQNPRATFIRRTAPLPGQEHPGLGLLSEMAGLLLVMCEALGLDGIVFVPAHYSTAALAQHHMRFLEPAEQARFDALRTTVGGMSLGEIERALAEGRIVDAARGDAVRWRPVPLVLPVSARLQELVMGAGYRGAYARARAVLEYRVATPRALETAP
jgi:acetoin utilization deacetylase AcuC-like enzyme